MSKKILALVLTLTLIGCSKGVVIKDEKVDPTPTKIVENSDLKQKIENLDNYVAITNAEDKTFTPSCDDYSKNFAKKVAGGDVKTLSLYSSKDNVYDLNLFLTPNYDKWEESDFNKVSKCGELGSILPLKIVSDKIVWGYPSCTGGAVPTSEAKGYDDFVKCTKVEVQLESYLGR